MRLVVGLGASRGVREEAVAALLARVLDDPGRVVAYASIDRRADEPGLLAAIAPAPLRTYPAAALDMVAVPNPGARAAQATGTGSVAEAAALLAAAELAGPDDEVRLRVSKTAGERCTAAVAELVARAPTRTNGTVAQLNGSNGPFVQNPARGCDALRTRPERPPPAVMLPGGRTGAQAPRLLGTHHTDTPLEDHA